MIGLWLLVLLGVLLIVVSIVRLIRHDADRGFFVFCLIFSAVISFSCLFYLYRTALGGYMRKDFRNNVTNGTYQTVSVYDANGDLIEEYSGKMYVARRENSVYFDDEDGLQHVIYFGEYNVVDVSEYDGG